MIKGMAFDWTAYRRAVANRKWPILALVTAVTALSVVIAVRTPNVYQARAMEAASSPGFTV